jgi:hypothetical protein
MGHQIRNVHMLIFWSHSHLPESYYLKSGGDNHVMNSWNTHDTDPPAMYLVFLWLFWAWVIQARRKILEPKDHRFAYYRGNDVREWLHWLKLLTSHPLSRRILNGMASKDMETWLSDISHQDCGIVSGDHRFSPWLSSIQRCSYQFYICRVSHLDWEQALRTIESAMAQDQQTVDGGGSEILHSTVDVRAQIGALYLCSWPDGSGGLPADRFNDICNFSQFSQSFFSVDPFRNFGVLPKLVMSTSAMIEFCNGLQTAHPTCCHKLGQEIIDWYSASVALLGITNSVDHSSWKCKRCTSCKAITSFRALLSTKKLPPNTNKQQLFDEAVNGLVSIFHCSTYTSLF